MAEYLVQEKSIVAIANAIREKTSTTETLTLEEMANKIFSIGGGDSHNCENNVQNFNVVCNPQPTNPKENTIWVNTDIEITGYHFSATQPKNMAEGEVWFRTSTSSNIEFNALKKNSIQVYPVSAKQYINGELVNVAVKSYNNGEWIDSMISLYNNGDLYSDITGGWIVEPKKYGGSEGGSSSEHYCAKITQTSPQLIIENTFTAWGSVVRTKEKIDLNNVNTLTFTGTMTESTADHVYSFGFGVWSSMGTTAKDNLASSIEFNNPSSEPSGYWNMNSVSIDVSTLMGKYYVGFFINTDVTICVDTIFIK